MQRSTHEIKTNYINGIEYFKKYMESNEVADLSLSIQFLRASIKEGCISARFQIILILDHFYEKPIENKELQDFLSVALKFTPSSTYWDVVGVEVINMIRDYKKTNAHFNELDADQKRRLINLLINFSRQTKNKLTLVKSCIYKVLSEFYKDDMVKLSFYQGHLKLPSDVYGKISSYFPSYLAKSKPGIELLKNYFNYKDSDFALLDVKEEMEARLEDNLDPVLKTREFASKMLTFIDTLEVAFNPPYAPDFDKSKKLKINLLYLLIEYLINLSHLPDTPPQHQKQILIISYHLFGGLLNNNPVDLLPAKEKSKLKMLEIRLNNDLLKVDINPKTITTDNSLCSIDNEDKLSYNFFVIIYNAMISFKDSFDDIKKASIVANYYLDIQKRLLSDPAKLHVLSREYKRDICEMAGYAYYILGINHFNNKLAINPDYIPEINYVKDFFNRALKEKVVEAKYWLLKLNIMELNKIKSRNFKQDIIKEIFHTILYYPSPGFKKLSPLEYLDLYKIICSHLSDAKQFGTKQCNILMPNSGMTAPTGSVYEYFIKCCGLLLSDINQQYLIQHEALFEQAKFLEYVDKENIAPVISLLYEAALHGSLIAMDYLENKMDGLRIRLNENFKSIKEMAKKGSIVTEDNISLHIRFIIDLSKNFKTISAQREVKDKMIIALIRKLAYSNEEIGLKSILLPIAEKLLQEFISQQRDEKFQKDIQEIAELLKKKRGFYPNSAVSINQNFLTNIEEHTKPKSKKKKKGKRKDSNLTTTTSTAPDTGSQPTKAAPQSPLLRSSLFNKSAPSWLSSEGQKPAYYKRVYELILTEMRAGNASSFINSENDNISSFQDKIYKFYKKGESLYLKQDFQGAKNLFLLYFYSNLHLYQYCLEQGVDDKEKLTAILQKIAIATFNLGSVKLQSKNNSHQGFLLLKDALEYAIMYFGEDHKVTNLIRKERSAIKQTMQADKPSPSSSKKTTTKFLDESTSEDKGKEIVEKKLSHCRRK